MRDRHAVYDVLAVAPMLSDNQVNMLAVDIVVGDVPRELYAKVTRLPAEAERLLVPTGEDASAADKSMMERFARMGENAARVVAAADRMMAETRPL